MIETMDQNRIEITKEVATLCFYMQGGIDFNQGYQLSSDQRRILSKVIEKHYSAMNSKGSGNLI